jgi:hypothetical protein
MTINKNNRRMLSVGGNVPKLELLNITGRNAR